MISSFTDLSPYLADLGGGLASVWKFLRSGGVFMFFLAACSLLGVTVIIYKTLTSRRPQLLPSRTVELLSGLHGGAAVSVPELQEIMQRGETPLDRVARAALLNPHGSREEAFLAAQSVAREELVHMERGLGLLEAIITAGPLFGLLGTASGLVSVFGNLASASNGDPSALAPGIAEALSTTIVGLFVAIPCVFAHSYFGRVIELVSARMEVLIQQALAAVWQPTPPAS